MGARPFWSELEIPEPRPAPSIASPLLLGLFMLMLAIFIIMVSFSTVAASRFRAVAQSMSDTFRSAQATVNFVPVDDDAPGTGNFPELGRLVQAAVPGARAEETPGADRLRVRLPTPSLFGRGRGVALTAGARALIAELATRLAGRPEALRYDVEYLIGRGKEGDWPLAAARAAVVAEALLAAGAPRGNLSVGIMPGGIETSAIVFLAHAEAGVP